MTAGRAAALVGGYGPVRSVRAEVIVLNGGSSSGTSGIDRCLQALLPEPWLVTGVDVLIESMPASPQVPDG